jgi:hypothetical protein
MAMICLPSRLRVVRDVRQTRPRCTRAAPGRERSTDRLHRQREIIGDVLTIRSCALAANCRAFSIRNPLTFAQRCVAQRNAPARTNAAVERSVRPEGSILRAFHTTALQTRERDRFGEGFPGRGRAKGDGSISLHSQIPHDY